MRASSPLGIEPRRSWHDSRKTGRRPAALLASGPRGRIDRERALGIASIPLALRELARPGRGAFAELHGGRGELGEEGRRRVSLRVLVPLPQAGPAAEQDGLAGVLDAVAQR